MVYACEWHIKKAYFLCSTHNVLHACTLNQAHKLSKCQCKCTTSASLILNHWMFGPNSGDGKGNRTVWITPPPPQQQHCFPKESINCNFMTKSLVMKQASWYRKQNCINCTAIRFPKAPIESWLHSKKASHQRRQGSWETFTCTSTC